MASPHPVSFERERSVMEFFFLTGKSTMEANMEQYLEQTNSLGMVNEQRRRFQRMFRTFLDNRKKIVDWARITPPPQERIIPYSILPAYPDNPFQTHEVLNKLVILKLNGGLGMSMGCEGPKSAIEVRSELTFLDLTVRQVEYVNSRYGVDVPLILMNSFNTQEYTEQLIKKYREHNITIFTFNQSKFPRILKNSLLPMPTSAEAPHRQWYPPGHGDLYSSFAESGLLDNMIAQGKEWVFISNVDNLGATVDLNILDFLMASEVEFAMEVTDKTRADTQAGGGTVIGFREETDIKLKLMEPAQVPPAHVEEFKSVAKFPCFNTNNLWVNLSAMRRIVDDSEAQLEVIVNHGTVDGVKIIQLETAAGSAIQYFEKSIGIHVSRERFLPIKNTSDLFLVQSELYEIRHGTINARPERQGSLPFVNLGDHFRSLSEYMMRLPAIPDVSELYHLTVSGDVRFGRNVALKGTVIIVANEGGRIDIPDGAILENNVVTGSLQILQH